MQTPCNIVVCKNLPIFQQLAYEEALLRVNNDNWCIINQGSPPACVLGISNDPEAHLKPDFPEHIPIIRRFSGGGSVVVDENTFFLTFILQNESDNKNPKDVLKNTFSIISPAFSHTDFRLVESDYAVGDKKVAGNAVYIARKRVLHHISFLFDYDEELMDLLLPPPTEPEYRNKRAHTNFLGKLRDHFSSMDMIQKQLLDALKTRFSLCEKEESSLKQISLLPHRKALTMRSHRKEGFH